MQRNWEAIIREWSLRWGDLVDGWWFDGVYAPHEMYTYDTPPNFGSWAAAARAGNNASILTFSFGEIAWGQAVTVEVRKTRLLFAPTFTPKTIFLPRQARDKHRDGTQKGGNLCSLTTGTATPAARS